MVDTSLYWLSLIRMDSIDRNSEPSEAEKVSSVSSYDQKRC